jgi:hypothetical protein
MKKLRLAEFVAAGLVLAGLNLFAPGAAFGQIRQQFQMPRVTPTPAPRVSQPAAQTQRSSSSQQTRSTSQSQPRQTTQGQSSQRQSQSSTQRTTTQSRTQSKQQAHQNKEQQKQQQKQQARGQKEQQKQQQKQQKEQARQNKERQKQQQKQQKEQQKQQAHQQKQKESQKQQKQPKSRKNAAPAPAPAARNSASPSSSAKTPTSAGPAKNSAAVLSPSQSQARIQQLNATRSNLSGINRRPLPAGQVTVHSNGRMTVNAEGGRQYGVRSNGTLASYRDREKTVGFDQRGKINSLHTANLDVYHGAHGQRTIVSRRADGSKVVSTGPHSGYVERPVVANNRSYIQRTTIVNQRVVTSTFVTSNHGGLVVAGFVPPVFFAPGFYGWAYYPWAAPIRFSWGWYGSPWYLGPNPYFVASPLYPGASLWLTDYMIGDTLATAYAQRKDAALSDNIEDAATDDSAAADTTANDDSEGGQPETIQADATTPITPEIKAEIAEEVKQELANDNAAAANTSKVSFDVLPTALQTPNHVFVVSNDLDVTTADQQICALQAGDMLQLLAPAESDAGLVQLRVASSKRMDCPAGILVSVSRQDLQEMQNSFQARIEAGLEKLRNDHGLAGLPAAPAEAVAAPPRPAVEGLAPVSAAATTLQIDQLTVQADQTESQTAAGTF